MSNATLAKLWGIDITIFEVLASKVKTNLDPACDENSASVHDVQTNKNITDSRNDDNPIADHIASDEITNENEDSSTIFNSINDVSTDSSVDDFPDDAQDTDHHSDVVDSVPSSGKELSRDPALDAPLTAVSQVFRFHLKKKKRTRQKKQRDKNFLRHHVTRLRRQKRTLR